MAIHLNPNASSWRCEPVAGSPIAFHRTIPGYQRTPLHDLPDLARELRVGRVLLKDESSRLGLPAFKVLGASYAIARALSQRLGAGGVLPLGELRSHVEGSDLRLSAATEGNHGRAVAHVARLLGLRAVIYVPPGPSPAALEGIRSEGAQVVQVSAPYDDVVAHAAAHADERTLLIQDTSWPGYEDIPGWIVEGYTTLVAEVDEALGSAPDVVVVPVGVGSLAHGVATHYRSTPRGPALIGVEPDRAPCLRAALDSGGPARVSTGETIMTGLNCGTISPLAWPVLSGGLDAAVTITEKAARTAVGDLTDLGADSGPCGAATLAGARALAADPRARGLLGADATVVLLSTEGRAANPKAG